MKKYYAVKIGKTQGIYGTWEECKVSVDGFPGAIYKSFKTYEEAEGFIGAKKSISNLKEPPGGNMVAYIDGGYNDKIKYYSYAGIIFCGGKKYSFNQRGNDSNIVSMRNVVGELKAAIKVMEYAKSRNVKTLDIYYDYIGIEYWVTGKWKAKTQFTQSYSQYGKSICKEMSVKFIKVKAHTGNKYNEEVDKLATQALYAKVDSNDHDIIRECEDPYEAHIEEGINEAVNEVVNEVFPTKLVNNPLQEIDWSSLLPVSKLNSLNMNYILDKKIVSSLDLINRFKLEWGKLGYKQKDIKELRVCFKVKEEKFMFFVSTEDQKITVEI